VPIYAFKVEKTGEVFEKYFDFASSPRSIRVKCGDGKRRRAWRSLADERRGRAAQRANQWSKPIISHSLACHPSQVAEREASTGVKHRADGTAVLTCEADRRKLCRALGAVDLDGNWSR